MDEKPQRPQRQEGVDNAFTCGCPDCQCRKVAVKTAENPSATCDDCLAGLHWEVV